MTEYVYERERISDGVYSAVNTGIEIIRCRDCANYYVADNYHPWGNVETRCCKYFDVYDDEVEPEGFCAWAERRDARAITSAKAASTGRAICLSTTG